jgi:hypothetical protein
MTKGGEEAVRPREHHYYYYYYYYYLMDHRSGQATNQHAPTHWALLLRKRSRFFGRIHKFLNHMRAYTRIVHPLLQLFSLQARLAVIDSRN